MEAHVLLVEDEQKTGEMLKLGLESEGIEVTWFKNGVDALSNFIKGKYDLVILDLKLPEMTGEEVLELLRKIDPYVEVMVYTNYQDPPVMKKLINLGIDGYVNKGSDADLWETVKKVKNKLDPFTEDEQEAILDSLPKGVFNEEE
jgi:DNA-binding response OmpR family regulator